VIIEGILLKPNCPRPEETSLLAMSVKMMHIAEQRGDQRETSHYLCLFSVAVLKFGRHL